MARKQNDRCPLQVECERKCTYEGHELDCDYYSCNARDELVIEDQETIRRQHERERDEQMYEELYGADLGEINREEAVAEASEEENHTADVGNIVMLPIDALSPHPDNPRKDVGDISELAESIKANGVLQNLTVVSGRWMSKAEWKEISERYGKNPTEEDRVLMNRKWLDGGYTVIIGHRRLAAAKLAGLTELPCVVVKMTPKEQVSTMLTENMQRVDLTLYEQANGFQMMLDLGESVEQIAGKSGFSKSTVRKRLEIAKLDQKTLKKVSGRQLSIGDFDELAKIDNIAVRNKLLASMGTANFQKELQAALKNQKLEQRMKEWLKVIQTFAIEDPNASYQNCRYVRSYGYYNMGDDVVVPKDADSVKYFYKVGKSQIDIYKERDVDKESAEKAEREERRRKDDLLRQQFDDVNNSHYELRCEFVKNLSNSVCKRNLLEVYGFVANAFYVVTDVYGDEMDLEKLSYLLGIKIEESDLEDDNRLTAIPGVRSALEAFPEKTMFCIAYCTVDDDKNGYWKSEWHGGRYRLVHRDNAELDMLYDVLVSLGYEMSDEEKAFREGTHELLHLSEAEENAEEAVG